MTTAPAPALTIPPAGNYKINSGASSISFTAKHMFGAGKVTGSFGVANGEIVIAEPVTASTVTASAPAGSFSTGHAKRDAKVLSATFLDADTYPDVSFSSTGLSDVGGAWVLNGNITARGVTAPVELKVLEAVPTSLGLRLRASGRVDRYNHGITKMKGMAGRHLDLEITAIAERA